MKSTLRFYSYGFLPLLFGLTQPLCHAVPLSTHPSSDPGLDIVAPKWEDSNLLKQAIQHLKRGERQHAKAKLAEFLKQSPNDPRGPELAGMILMEEKNYAMAALSFERANTLNPNSPATLSKLGVALLLHKKEKEGEAMLNRAIALRTGEPLARRYLGWLDEKRGNLNGAARHYLAALSGGLLPNQLTEIHLALGRVYSALGRNEQTIRLLSPLAVSSRGTKEAVQAAQFQLAFANLELKRSQEASSYIRHLETQFKPENPELRYLKAYAELESNPPAARKKLENLADTHSGYAGRVRLLIARSYALEGKYPLAAKELESLAADVQAGDLPEVLTALVAVHIAHGKPQEAEKVLTVYAEKFPNIPEVDYLLAETQLQTGKVTQAHTLLKHMIAKYPRHAQAYALLGQIERSRNSITEAETNLRKAVAIDSNLANAWVNLAGIHFGRKEFAKAEAALKQGLATNPGNAILQNELANIYDSMGRWREANALYRTILASYPSYLPALNNLALNLAEDGDLINALKYAEQAHRLDKTNLTIQDTYGWILTLNNKASAGLPLLQQAAKGLPNDPAVSYHLGAALIKTGKTAEGKTYIQRALASGLSEYQRKKALAYLQ